MWGAGKETDSQLERWETTLYIFPDEVEKGLPQFRTFLKWHPASQNQMKLLEIIFQMRINDNCLSFLALKPSKLEFPKESGDYSLHFTDGRDKSGM